MTELWMLTARGLAHSFLAGTASPTEALESCLQRISNLDESIGAFSTVLTNTALTEASERTAELLRGETRGPLHGIPVAIKELFDVRGAIGDYGSDVLAGRTSDSDAELVRRLRRAGAVVVGTTRSHEFGWGITTQHPTRMGTRNPRNLERVPGGSSGGSAAAVASGMVPLAVGSDTGGSVRIPASFCGINGLKPSFGLVSRTGGVALAPSFDTPGALGRSMDDVAMLVSAMSGADPADPGCAGRSFRYEPYMPSTIEGARIGRSANLMGPGLDPSVGEIYERAINTLEELGAEIVEIDLPDAQSILDAFVPLQMAEAHHVHNQSMGIYPEHEKDYGADVRLRLHAAASVTVADYLRAQEERRRIIASFDRQLQFVDALISPISAVGPSRIDNSDEGVLDGEVWPLRELVMPFTVPQNMTGLPTGIVRAGHDADHLPVGVQLTAPRWREDTAVAVAGALQLALGPIKIADVPNRLDGS